MGSVVTNAFKKPARFASARCAPLKFSETSLPHAVRTISSRLDLVAHPYRHHIRRPACILRDPAADAMRRSAMAGWSEERVHVGAVAGERAHALRLAHLACHRVRAAAGHVSAGEGLRAPQHYRTAHRNGEFHPSCWVGANAQPCARCLALSPSWAHQSAPGHLLCASPYCSALGRCFPLSLHFVPWARCRALGPQLVESRRRRFPVVHASALRASAPCAEAPRGRRCAGRPLDRRRGPIAHGDRRAGAARRCTLQRCSRGTYLAFTRPRASYPRVIHAASDPCLLCGA
eukprot:6206344-Pleurochrysis_carterae.AAC.3